VGRLRLFRWWPVSRSTFPAPPSFVQDDALAVGAMRFIVCIVRKETEERVEQTMRRNPHVAAYAPVTYTMDAAERGLLAAIRADKVPYEGGARLGPLESPGGELSAVVKMHA
jgi:hypothetical protein